MTTIRSKTGSNVAQVRKVGREAEVKASVVDRYMRRDIWFSIPNMQTAGRERVK